MDLSFIPSGLVALVDKFSKNPFSFIAVIFIIAMLGGMGFLGYMSVTDRLNMAAFFSHAQPSPVEEAQRLQESIPRDAATCGAVDELGRSLRADRATYWAFSNGAYGLGGVPWNYANVHCPFVSEGIAFIPDNFDKVPNAITAEINAILFPDQEHTACGVWPIEKIKSTYLRASMRSVGTDILYECGVRDLRGIPIGKIVVSWRNRINAPKQADIISAIKQTADDIGRVNTPTIPLSNL